MKKCNVKFFSNNGELYWKCPNNMGYQTPRKEKSTHCWKHNCPGRCEINLNAICAFDSCKNLKRQGSKYCTDECRKKNSRRNYLLKKRTLSSQA
jgi:hypothetical protein